MDGQPARHDYEDRQSFNALTKLLHSTRYKNLTRIVQDLAPAYGPRLRVLDIGCGVGEAYRVLDALRDDLEYVGVELRDDFADLARQRYGDRENFEIHRASISDRLDLIDRFDLLIGLETFEHIPEGEVVRIVEAIGRSDFQRLYITVPNEIGPALAIKNVGSFLMGYVRHRQYTWRETFYASIYELDKVGVHTTQHRGFDWRWLAQTLRQNVRIIRKYTSPLQIVPRAVSPSIGFLCVKRP